MSGERDPALAHPFLRQPNRTILYLSAPILLSLVAEPLTGLIDTAFVARLGTEALAALGVGSGALSSIFWVFNFLGVATQTEVAQTLGRRDVASASKAVSLALAVGIAFSLLLAAVLALGAEGVARALGAEGVVLELAAEYILLRLLGSPAVMVVIIGFGALRGLQDMRTPLWIALGINLANVVLDYVMIFGWLFLPAWGVAGAAVASAISQWLGAILMLRVLRRRIGLTRALKWREAAQLLRVGKDLVIRSASLTLFMIFATRVATQMGAEAGAAHQVIRQVWFFTAMLAEAVTTTAQSLVGYFCGAGRMDFAKRVAAATMRWSLATGVALMALMLASTPVALDALVPAAAAVAFQGAWVIAALSQPLNALAFVTDGIHWGSGDYRFLRNAMIFATVLSLFALHQTPTDNGEFFSGVWLATVFWIAVRALWGVARVFPGFGDSPFRGLSSGQ